MASTRGLRVVVVDNDPDALELVLIDAVRTSGATYLPKGNLRLLRRAVLGDPIAS